MIDDINSYKLIVFDCDGVILDSNKVKTAAFYNAALPYGESYANKLVEYHVKNGGISRYHKFEYFLKNIIGKAIVKCDLDALLKSYADEVVSGLMKCKITDNLSLLREKSNTDWMIASGGDQDELREIFKSRGIDSMFNAGIYGSPDTKDEIFKREILDKKLNSHTLFLGDSRYDYLASVNVGIDFIFVSGWSELFLWEDYISEKNIQSVKEINDLFDYI